MKKIIGFLLVCFVIAAITFACKKEVKGAVHEETLVAGTATIYVDNTLQPIVEDVLAVFHNVYDRAAIKQVNASDKELMALMQKDSAAVLVMPRLLTPQEELHFKNKKIQPRITEFGSDGIALITNTKYNDSVINLEEVIKILQGKSSDKVKALVFDNPNSGTIDYMTKLAGVSALPAANIYALKTNEDVIKYVHDNDGAIGVIGVNWLLQAPPSLTNFVENIRVLGVDNVKKDKAEKKYYKPNQTNLATGSYPLARKMYVLNYQGKLGLGMGFASYIGGIEGQRIILKSGLLPLRIPSREISVRDQIQTTTNK